MKSLKNKTVLTISCILFSFCGLINAQLTVSNYFGNNMVIQRQQPIKVMGNAKPNQNIELKFADQKQLTTANAEGKWQIVFNAMPAGGPFNLSIKAAKEQLNYSNIMLGDVWFCSGQSNMEFALRDCINGQNIVDSSNYPNLRFFRVPHKIAFENNDTAANVTWKVMSPATSFDFSAVTYFFGLNLYKKLGVPIGFIHSNWGGTNIESWMPSNNNTDLNPDFKDYVNKSKKRIEELKALWVITPSECKGPKDINNLNWVDAEVPGYLENYGYPGFNGTVWYKKSINVDSLPADSKTIIHLGYVDDADSTWINGQFVGTTNEYNIFRNYVVPTGVLKKGNNQIVVRVDDFRGAGGFWGSSTNFELLVDTNRYALNGKWKFKPCSKNAQFDLQEPGPNDIPQSLYYGMVEPYTQFPVKGVIWYQGEANVTAAAEYKLQFQNLINGWRKAWRNPDMAFCFVQLANYLPSLPNPSESDWAELREAQTTALQLPNIAMAVAIDIGEANNIHPKNKQEVGKRLYFGALKAAYHMDAPSSVIYMNHEIVADSIIVSFSPTSAKIFVSNNQLIKGFAIAGVNRVFYWANAKIENNKLVVWSPNVTKPLAVRYAWADNPEGANLYNEPNLPVSPFRTDCW